VEHCLSRSMGSPVIISLSTAIQKRRKAYYDALEQSNKHNDITVWLEYFLPLLLDAQQESIERVRFVIRKSQFYEKHGHHMSERQKKAIERMFREGIDGFR